MIYLDNAATTPIAQPARKAIIEALDLYSNPSALYRSGKEVKHRLTQARKKMAMLLGVDPADLFFTSGATEANNWGLMHLAYVSEQRTNRKHIVSTAIEHPSVHNVLKHLMTQGYEVDFLLPNQQQTYTVDQFMDASRPDTLGWIAMSVNNETGDLLPVKELGQVAQENGWWFHTDHVQSIAHETEPLSAYAFDTLVGSAHKFGGPKGVGFMVYRSDRMGSLTPFIFGGGQEKGMRSGTENVPYILGMVEALDLARQSQSDLTAHYRQLSKHLYDKLTRVGINYERNGSQTRQVPYIHNLWIKDQLSSQLLIQLDLAQIAVSAGSACSAGSIQPSRILQSYYPNDPQRWNESIRISFGVLTTTQEIDQFVDQLAQIIN